MSLLEVVAGQDGVAKKSNYWWKILLITIFSGAFALLAGLSLGNIFTKTEFLGASSWLMFLIFLGFFAILFLIESLGANSARFGSIVFQSLLFTTGFYLTKFDSNFDKFILLWNIGVCLILMLCLWMGRLVTRKRKADFLKLRWSEITKTGLTIILIGINLFICLQWMGEVILKPELLVTPEAVDSILKPATPIFKLYFGENFSPKMSIDSFIKDLSTKQVEMSINEKNQELANVPKETINKQKEMLIEQNFNLLKTQLSEQLEMELGGNEAFDLVAFQFLNNKYQKLDVSLKQYIILAIALLMFIILRILAIFIAFLVRIVGWFVYELLIASGYLAMKYESRNKEDLAIY